MIYCQNDTTLKNVVVLLRSVANDGGRCYRQMLLEEALYNE